MSTLGIGVSALAAAQAGMQTTGHNISNVNTAGFHRQQTIQVANLGQATGSGFIGQGVHVATVKRVYLEMLDSQVLQAQTQSSHLESYFALVKQLDNMLADPSAGVSPALQEFFSGVHDVAANPASVPSRQAMLSSTESLVARFQSIDQRFTEISDGVNSAITSDVGVINSYSNQIATLNQSIAIAQGAAGDQPPNDLLDQRDQLIGELNQIVKVSTFKQSDGSLSVFVGNGQALVIGAQSFALAAAISDEDPGKIEMGVSVGGKSLPFAKGSLTGGTLGGMLAFRDEILSSAQNALGRVAIGLAQTFNDQHKLGMDMNGALGGDFFSVASPKAFPNANNAGSASLTPPPSFSNVALLSTSDYKIVATDALGNFTMTRLSDGKTVLPASEGLAIVMTAGASVGDSFLIKPTVSGAHDIALKLTDTSSIAAAAPVRTAATLGNTGTGVISAGAVNTGTPVTPDPAHPTTDLNLLQPVTITFNALPLPAGSTFNVNSPTSVPPVAVVGAAYTSGANISFNGWTVQISGTPAAGDTFTVGSNAGGVSDNRNALLLAGLQTQNTLASGTTSYQGAYSQLVSLVGNKAHEVEVTAKAQASLVTQTQQAQQSVSGVNLDEEAANLMRYQQAYQAAGKMMQIANTLFDTLLSLGK